MTSDLQTTDELDLLGYFFEHGDLRKEEYLKDVSGGLFIHGYSEKIDRWYSYLSGEVKSAEKPMLKEVKK
jgi:rhamnogalacturonyl hydrolase YesR